MNSYYNQEYTAQQIDGILDKIKNCVACGRFTVSLNENRQENIDFINEYNIRSGQQASIILQIKTEDFCHSLQNTKIGFEYEMLYVFVPQVELFDAGGEETAVDIYTKFNIIERSDSNHTVVVSFHKANKPF